MGKDSNEDVVRCTLRKTIDETALKGMAHLLKTIRER
jgi:hypothetical protein